MHKDADILPHSCVVAKLSKQLRSGIVRTSQMGNEKKVGKLRKK